MQAIKRLKETPTDQISSVFIITGEEELLMKRYLNTLIHLVVPPEMQDLNLMTFEGKDFTLEGLLEALETLPVMAEKKLVVVKNPSFLETKGVSFTDKEERKILHYLDQPSSGTCLVFYCPRKPDGRKKIFKAIRKVARTEDFQRLKEPELRQFIGEEIQQSGKTIDGAALKKFAQSFDYFGANASQNLQDVSNEIQKMTAYLGKQTRISLEHVQETTHAAFQNDIFLLIESFASKQAAETQVRLHKLLGNGEPLMKIIGYLRNQFKMMLRARELSQQGYTASKMATKLKQHPYAMEKTLAYSKRFEERDLVRLLNGFLTLDRQMKQGSLEAQTSMELLIADVCQP
jgi:DNA polymerase-3 subunit delta